MTIQYTLIDSPAGKIWVAWCRDGLVSVGFADQAKGAQIDSDWEFCADLRCDAVDQLKAYFANRLQSFDLPLSPDGTEFQQQVWAELQRIPFGETISYGELARRIRKPTASRAVGAANGQNPIPIVIPCHRVIGSNGALTGFGGGLPTKEFLLRLESPLFATTS